MEKRLEAGREWESRHSCCPGAQVCFSLWVCPSPPTGPL